MGSCMRRLPFHPEDGLGPKSITLTPEMAKYNSRVKVLSPEYAADPSMRQRFIAEARIQAKLSHPHVVNILNYLEDTDNGTGSV